MTQFAKMIGGGGDFHTTLKNKLQDFRHGSDYITFYEVFGNVRRQHYVIFTSKAVSSLRKVDWEKLKDFKSVEIGETNDPRIEDTVDNEAMKFIVESIGKEWVSEYQTTNKTGIPEEVRRQKVEIMIKQLEAEAKRTGKSFNSELVEARFKWTNTAEDVSYSQLKSFAGIISMAENISENADKLADFDNPSAIHAYQKSFDGDTGNWEQRERGSASSSSGSSTSKKYCSSCNRERPANNNFCQTCGQRLNVIEESRIQEITDQEAKQIEQQRPFFPKPRGNY